MIRLIAADLDGTIIDSSNNCDISVSEEIRRLRKMGVRFAICSGRPLDSLPDMLEGWHLDGLTDYIIGSNGGEVLDMNSGERKDMFALRPDMLRYLWDLYEPLGLIPTYQIGNDMYLPVITPQARVVEKRVGLNLVQGDVRTMDIEPRVKTLFILDPENMADVERFAAEHPDPRYIAYKTAVDLFEMSDPRVAKDLGVRTIAEMMGIGPEEIMTFGDTTNDIKMLEYAKYGICLANGTDDAKAAAYDIGPAMSDNGFAAYLQKHLPTPEFID